MAKELFFPSPDHASGQTKYRPDYSQWDWFDYVMFTPVDDEHYSHAMRLQAWGLDFQEARLVYSFYDSHNPPGAHLSKSLIPFCSVNDEALALTQELMDAGMKVRSAMEWVRLGRLGDYRTADELAALVESGEVANPDDFWHYLERMRGIHYKWLFRYERRGLVMPEQPRRDRFNTLLGFYNQGVDDQLAQDILYTL